ncbi:Neutral/alkaline non-lysosomal ceramidase, N-terminal [Cyclobacterium lianum]|uniref:Neutral/alkaline non-lysosomal ceramidase, N-terminal n=1 Tax=Cyclobacterium lianum TaxID=388280 RepID=A0A1M7Q571_9BACT|nr:neutral/alkaline non-lysosomal ceramidase N-terminal domain-containing protein [Cyclobacterium lianum]SHN25307.1 Neutral/alkaline non-lysosomal ceramidase, N-terminal [Cyclobacterium lianum]
MRLNRKPQTKETLCTPIVYHPIVLTRPVLIFLIAVLLAISSQNAHARQADGDKTTPIKVFRAGAATSVITPKIGTSINGGMQNRTVLHIHDDTHARSLVLDDGATKLAFVTLDLCMAYRETIDRAKLRAQKITSIPVENMLISATHTHSAGTACSVFQSDPDSAYLSFLEERTADAIIRAYNNLEPAKIGWGFGQESSQVFNRRWKMKPGAVLSNPFGGEDQVKMNPGIANPDLLEPAGPIDPELPVVAVQSIDGRPIALMANYSLHYVGGTGSGEISADYFGMFARKIKQMIGADQQKVPFVAMMSNGSSGDINNINFAGPVPDPQPPYAQMEMVANTLAAEAFKVYQQIEFKDWVPLGVVQTEISLGVRKPGANELQRAELIMSEAAGPNMVSMEEIYARETVLISDYPDQENILLQAIRLGDLAITAIPCEVFVEIGLGIKKESPFDHTFSVSLSNGYYGYLPTPEHHALGGYETWRARSSYLEEGASVKISDTLLELLGQLKSSPATSRYSQPLNADELDLGKTVKLFNGQNLAGWYTFLKDRGKNNDPKNVFTVKDGLIHISGEEWGCITTEEEYEDYKLLVEFKWAGGTHEPRLEKARDSGVLLHSRGKDGSYSGTWMNSIECQIIEGGTGDFIVVGDGTDRFAITSPVAPEKVAGAYVYQPNGDPVTVHGGRVNWFGRDPDWKDEIDFRGVNDVENPVGEWNTLECHVFDGEITVYLNGILVNRALNVKPRSGKIQIQSEAAELILSRVEISPILN